MEFEVAQVASRHISSGTGVGAEEGEGAGLGEGLGEGRPMITVTRWRA